MTAHDPATCAACTIRADLHAHRDATYPTWGTERGVLNYAAVIAGRACPEWRPSSEEQ